MKKVIISIIVILTLVFCFFIGNYISKIISMGDNKNTEIAEMDAIEDECTAEYENYKSEIANANEKKISPNAKVIENIYYKECGHTVTNEHQIEQENINKTKEELEKIYKDYEIKSFEKDLVEIYKEEEGICNEHFIVSSIDGYVVIYNLDSDENKVLLQTTDIQTAFLTTTDIARIEGGINIYGRENLNKLLEDFES